MHFRRAFLSSLLLVTFCMAEGEQDRAALKLDPGAPVADVDASAKLIFEQTNAFRAENRLPALKPNDALTATAKSFAKFMADSHKYGHEADGRQPADRATAKGYAYCLVLENIAMQFRSDGFAAAPLATAFVEAWKNSPGHRKAMLSPHATEAGMAVAMAPNGVYYAVQLFGRPESMMFDIRLENRTRTAVHYTINDQPHDLPPRAIRTHTVCLPPTLGFTLPNTTTPPKPADLTPQQATTYVITDKAIEVKQGAPK